jgi:hypothetical protein
MTSKCHRRAAYLSLKMLSCFHFSNLEMEQVEHDPDFIMLSRQFKATAMELISVLEQVKACNSIT